MLNSLEMDQSHSESDVSLSPSRILERLQELRQIQLLQKGKLQKQRSQYENSPETSSSVTEIVSHFSNSTSYNTFRNLLQSSQETSDGDTPRLNISHLSQKVQEQDLIEGVSLLNLSQESEIIINSPTSIESTVLPTSKPKNDNSSVNKKTELKVLAKKQISLDEMPILTPKQNFEALVIEKLHSEKYTNKSKSSKEIIKPIPSKKPFLRKGEGMTRFGIKKNDFVIQSTKSLPWKCKSIEIRANNSPVNKKAVKPLKNTKVPIQILVTKSKPTTIKHVTSKDKMTDFVEKSITLEKPKISSPQKNDDKEISSQTVDSSNSKVKYTNIDITQKVDNLKGEHPLLNNKGKTWAAILTKEQDDFLRQLKQSDYYKNFASPAKSTVSDISCDENLLKLKQERETAEQNMFELLEKKVTQESFNLESSFFNRFLKISKLECSGESTPLIMQKCLANNPSLMHIFPDLTHRKRNEDSYTDSETCNSEHIECCSDACSSVSTNCSCKTVEETNNSTEKYIQDNIEKKKDTGHKSKTNKANTKEVEKPPETEKSQNDTDINNDTMKANMVEMNAKLIATSELLKERLHELEDEIETFRKENANLSKMREEVDLERQKFYEEKTAFEQKFNEEKILSEYYLAEEKEKLNKQKVMYERYVREMRGRLNKKDKDEVINLKKEVNDLKEEIRLKDAKSTSTIARLRNQIKIMEKEKKVVQDEVEKLKKENRRIQHSNDMTRRLTNLKYLEEINKKLAHMTSRDTQSEVCIDSDVKYKTFEIEKQSKNRKVQPVAKLRPRAKSVPNLNVTSKYAKYFSQRDAISQMEKNKSLNVEHVDIYTYPSDNNDTDNENNINSDDTDFVQDRMSDNEDENNLEKMYKERFQSNSPKSNRSSLNSTTSRNSEKRDFIDTADNFFIRKSASNTTCRNSKSPSFVSTSSYLKSIASNSNKSSITGLSNGSSSHKSSINNSKAQYTSSNYISNISEGPNTPNRSKSPVSILSNRSSSSQKFNTVIYQEPNDEGKMLVSPEPSTSKTSLMKTHLNPTEIKKSDGSRELRFPNGNVKYISADGKYSKFLYYNGDVKENFYDEGRIKYFYAETKTFHTTHADGLEVLEFPDGQVEKRYKDGSSEIRLPNGSIRYFDPKNEHVREEWRFPDGAALTVSADGEQRIVFSNGQVEVHAKDHKRREFPDGTVKLVYNDGTSETRYASGRIRIKDKHGNLIMDSAPG